MRSNWFLLTDSGDLSKVNNSFPSASVNLNEFFKSLSFSKPALFASSSICCSAFSMVSFAFLFAIFLTSFKAFSKLILLSFAYFVARFPNVSLDSLLESGLEVSARPISTCKASYLCFSCSCSLVSLG